METDAASRIPSVAEYYAGKNLFITGATGFIGKVFLEKVLRSCPDIEGIYCLVRPKKGQDASQRMQNLCEDKVFDKLRTQQPDFSSKLHAIHGDIIDDDLGIKEDDRTFLEQNIHLVYHSAATIRFDEHIRLAVQMNILPVRKMIKLAKKMQKLECFVHVSTAYANCDREYIEEVIYPSPVEPQKLIDIVEWMDDACLEAITPKLVGNKPNTYTFTKQIAETLLIQEGGDLPLAIVRPSIVTAAWKEPIQGWIDNLNGPSGLYIAAGKGLLRTFKAYNNSVADIIPVDFPANIMITCAWYTAVTKPPRNALIYQITSGLLNPFTWGEMETFFTEVVRKKPMEQCFRRPPTRIISTNKMLHDYWVMVSHTLPAYAADLGFMLLGKKPRMVKIYDRLHKAMSTLEYFTVRTWQWTHDNLDTLRTALGPADAKAFYFDVREVHWESYTEAYVMGTKKYILKEDLSNMDQARAHLRMLRNVRYVFNTLLLVIFWRVFIAKSQIARNSWYFILSLVYKFVQFFRITSTIKP